MKRRKKKEEVVEEKAVPMAVEDYERLIHLIGENLFHSIKNIQLAIEAAQLMSKDDEFKNALWLFLERARAIERDMNKASLKNDTEVRDGLTF